MCLRRVASARQQSEEAVKPTRITVFLDSGCHTAILPGEVSATEDVSRHAPLRAALPVLSLTVAMIEPALGAVLMATVGAAPLFAKGWDATSGTAITLTAITGATDEENRAASTAYSLPKNNLSRQLTSQCNFRG